MSLRAKTIDIGPAATERRAAPEERVHGLADQGQPVAHRLLAGCLAVHFDRGAQPAQHGLVVGAQELEPILHPRLNGAGRHLLHRESGLLDAAKIVIERLDRQEDLVSVVDVRLHPGFVIEQWSIRGVARIVAHQSGGDLVNRPHRLVQDPLARPSLRVADISGLHERSSTRPQHPSPGCERVREIPIEVNRVGGRDRIGAARQQLGPDHLVEELEPLLLLEPAQEAKRDPLLVTELVQGDTEKFRRAVHDQHSDLTIEDPKVQPVEEDPRSPRVIDQDLAVLEVASEILDRRVEVPVPPVVLDRVVPEAEGVHGLAGPILVRDPLEALRPLKTAAGAPRLLDRGTQRPVDAQELWDGGGERSSPAAHGGDAEAAYEAAGDLHTTERPVDTAGVMDQAQVELRLGTQPELTQRGVVRLVESLPWNW